MAVSVPAIKGRTTRNVPVMFRLHKLSVVHGLSPLLKMPVLAVLLVVSRFPLLIPIKLAPLIFIHDIGQRYTADWSKPAHRVPDRQQSIGMYIGR
jgi:hypothetical protein